MRQPNDATIQRPGQRPGRRGREDDDRSRTPQGPIVPDQVDQVPRGAESIAGLTRSYNGSVENFAVGEDGLIIKLNCGAISHRIIRVGPEAPHFRSAVSIAMLAYNARFNLGTLGGEDVYDNTRIAVSVPAAARPRADGSETAVAVGLGREALNFKDWIISPEDLPT